MKARMAITEGSKLVSVASAIVSNATYQPIIEAWIMALESCEDSATAIDAVQHVRVSLDGNGGWRAITRDEIGLPATIARSFVMMATRAASYQYLEAECDYALRLFRRWEALDVLGRKR